MSPRLVALAGCLLLLPSLAIAHPVSVGHVSAWMGDKWLDSYDAPCAAFDAMVGPGPVLLDIYGSGSWHSGSNSVGGLLDQNSYELGVGVGRIWSLGSFHPRLSAGFARVALTVAGFAAGLGTDLLDFTVTFDVAIACVCLS